MGIGCALSYHTGVQMLNLIVGSKKNATFNGFSLAGNTAGAIIVFHFISQLFGKLHYGTSLQIFTGSLFFISMVFSLIYLIPQRYISQHMEKTELDIKGNLSFFEIKYCFQNLSKVPLLFHFI